MDLLKKPPQNWGQFESPGDLVNPSVNFIDNGQKFIVEVMAPGMSIHDFRVTADNGKLWIEGLHNGNRNREKQYVKREFPHEFIRFRRYFDLDEDINPHNFKQYYSRGILKLIFEKRKYVTGERSKYDLIKAN